jgi:hypothetical protein
MAYTRSSHLACLLRQQDFDLQALSTVITPAAVDAALTATGRATLRVRKLTLRLILWLVIAMNLWTAQGLGAVLATLLHTLRLDAPTPEAVPGDSAISYRRAQLGVRPLWHLFRHVCRPLAPPDLPGAFVANLRLMIIDGTTYDLPETPANARAFGYSANQYRQSAFPQMQTVALLEAGTHAIVDAVAYAGRTSEQRGVRTLLRSVTAGMLLLLDRGLHSYDHLVACRARQAHVLGRLPANVTLAPGERLPDGTVRTELRPAGRGGRSAPTPLPVRLIHYTIDDPQAAGTTYRLVTTLLDASVAPAHALAVLYHERWEAELTFDELKTHQRLPAHPFRSQTPAGVLQEFYGLLLAHYALRALMVQSGVVDGHDPDRLSFTQAVQIVQRYLPDCHRARGAERRRLHTWLLADLRTHLLPPRRSRANPRVVKRRRSNFPTKQRPPTDFRTRRPVPELIRLI